MEKLGKALQKFKWFSSLIKCIEETYYELGYGLLEINYQKSIEYCLSKRNVSFLQEHWIDYKYNFNGHGQNVGQNVEEYKEPNFKVGSGRCDIMIEKEGILEIKAQKSEPRDEDIRQLQNYLIHSKCKIGICINFPKSIVNPNVNNATTSFNNIILLIHSSLIDTDDTDTDQYYIYIMRHSIKLKPIHNLINGGKITLENLKKYF